VDERWIGVALAATSVGQLLVAELMSRKSGEFGKKYFDNIIAADKKNQKNELGLPNNPAMRERLTDEVFGTAQLATAGATVLAAEIAAFAGLLATLIIAVQARKPAVAWVSGIAALGLVLFAIGVIVQLLGIKLSSYVVGKPAGRQKKTRSQESSAWRRLSNNVLAVVDGYFRRGRSLHTLTPYKTSIVAAAIWSAVIGVLI
jgi:hypothetical protein